MMKKINVTQINNEHNSWLRSLDFYKTEVIILRGMLTEVAKRNTASEIMKEVEHFENQFKIQVDNIDRLSHNIHVNIDTIGKQAQESNAGYVEGALAAEHTALGEQFESEEHVVRDLIKSFRKFAEQWM
jgi:hypothetical protein